MTNELIFKQLESIKQTSSRNSKMELLEEYLTDSLFEKTARFLCDTMIVTNISAKKIKKKTDVSPDETIDSFQEFIDYLTFRVSGKDSSIKTIQNYIDSFEDNEHQKIIMAIATKNYKWGTNISTLNKVLKKMNKEQLFDFQVQLANHYSQVEKKESKKNPNWLGHFFITLKVDGIRVAVLKKNGKVKLYSRSGKLFEEVNDIVSEFNKDIYPDNTFYDGEVLALNPDNYNSSKLFSRTQSIMNSKGVKTGVEYHMFDTMPIEEFESGKSKLIYSERRKVLNAMPETDLIHILPVLYEGTDVEMIQTLSDKLIIDGLEGIMVNTDVIYESKRVKSLLKIKNVIDCDGTILSVYEGTNKNEGSLGGVYMSYEYEDKDENIQRIEVKVGSGFSDTERVDIWENPEDYIGKIAEYIITEIIEDKEGNPDVRFARWSRLRDDKTEESF